ncbi:MAG TPA: type VI secretion system tip protein TssI/VgrG [Tepidisphaeraceae bacterium]|jgi:type VI secretion system secreted protein VgrG
MTQMIRNRTQAHRPAAAYSPLGEDVLLLRRMTGVEQLGRLYEYELELVSEHPDQVDFDKILGAPMSVRLDLGDGSGTPRAFHGIVSRFSQVSTGPELPTYRATLVPWLWLLTRTADCRIFQDDERQKWTVPKIILGVFRDFEFSSGFRDALSGTYPGLEYCVQYRETSFDFVSRLMEREGIYYFFEHTSDTHTMVLADATTPHEPYPGYAELIYRGRRRTHPTEEHIASWEVRRQVQPGTVALRSYDFTHPANDLQVASKVQRANPQSNYEVYDFPGTYFERDVGEQYAKVRIEEFQAGYEVVTAEATSRGVACGYTFKVAGIPESKDIEYLVTSARYEIFADAYESTLNPDNEPLFKVTFTAIPTTQTFRPARATRRPLIRGPQTGVVVGPGGEEIYTDKYGRVKVQFPWDRYGKANEDSSCWIRVAQPWAGKAYGVFHLPRVGQEVVVEYLEGDPDRPLVVGSVHNAETVVPYPLPGNKTVSTIKSNTSKGGAGFNEIRFEDKKGNEQIFIHGERNQDIRIKNDCFEWIGRDRHLVVKNSQFEHVELDRHEAIDGNHQEQIKQDRHTKIDGKEAREVGGSQSLKVGGDVAEQFGANHSEVTSKDYCLKADNIVIEGLTNVTIKVGQSYIAIEAGGIKIGTTGTIELESQMQTKVNGMLGIEMKGLTIEAKADTQVSVEGGAMAKLTAPMTQVNGDGMLMLKGGLVMIN